MIKQSKRFITLLMLALLAVTLMACSDADEEPTVIVPTAVPTVEMPTDAPTAMPTEPMATPTEAAMSEGSIVVETVNVTKEDGTVQVAISGNLSDACTQIQQIEPTFSLNTNTYDLNIQTERPEDELCAQVLTPFEETITLETVDMMPGMYTVIAQAESATFELTAADQDESMSDASAFISPMSGTAGTMVSIQAAGLAPNVQVELGVGQVASEYEVVATAVTAADGTLDTNVQISEFAEAGDDWVVVIEEPNGAKTVSNEFSVVAASNGGETGFQFEETSIYLIALEDGGQSGEEIGCGDSAIPVTIDIEPTIAPLTAALENMFAIDEQYYGQSGLYNALHQSNLSVQGIDIDNGHATIALTGDLTMGGTCDTPRVEAQLKETARQYSTIDTVSITINGQPLDSMLSARGS